jgi:hypothetical protein
MNPTLAAMYNTHNYGSAVHQEQVKIAHLELFAKSAAALNIDLGSLDQASREALYGEFRNKLAEEGGEPPEALEAEGEEEEAAGEAEKEEGEEKVEKAEEEEKKEAQAQFAAMKDWQSKVAEADFLGRQMAHAFTDERNKIAAATKVGGRTKRASEEEIKKDEEEIKKDEEEIKKDEEKKEAAAFDLQAARLAVKTASAGGWNEQQAAQRLEALFTLGLLPAMSKTASATTYPQALNIRALELLEAASYPIDWSKV